MKPDYSSFFYDIKNNPLLRNCYVDKGKKPLELDELKECYMETFEQNMTPEYFEHSKPKIIKLFDYFSEKIKFDENEKVPMNEFIRLFCTRRI